MVSPRWPHTGSLWGKPIRSGSPRLSARGDVAVEAFSSGLADLQDEDGRCRRCQVNATLGISVARETIAWMTLSTVRR